MKWICPAYAAVEKICGPQRFYPDREYRLSAHCLSVPCPEGTLLFHTLMGSLCLLEAGETWESFRQELAAARFLVPLDFNDMRYADTIRKLMQQVLPAKMAKTGFTVLTTTDCNARCFYCYEMGQRRFSMTEQAAHDVAAYMVKASQGQQIALTWFGGEPLYNVPVIDVICADLAKAGASFESRMISNGFFLDEEVARRAAKDWRLGSVQITLDGTKEVYNRTKAYIHCTEDAYERVLQNIDAALKAGICVYVRLNMDARNADDLMRLAEELAARFAGRSGLAAYPVLLKTFVGQVHSFASEEESVRRYFLLEDRLKRAGLWQIHPFQREISANQCMADRDDCEVILPDGRICKCEHFSEEGVVGSIYAEARDEAKIRAWKERSKPFPSCEGCALYPRCINLARCDWVKDGCSWSLKTIRRKHIEEQILDLFRKKAAEEL